jgi:hypothetical protein
MSLLAPVGTAALPLPFWKRSLFYGLAVINAMMLGKTAWSFYYGGESGRALLPPALVGLVICDVVISCTSCTGCAGKRGTNPSQPPPPVTSSDTLSHRRRT